MMSRVGVVPYDVWQSWVAIAGLTPGDYADLAAVIASSTARTALTANTTAGKNAMKYMVASTSVIMPAVVASSDFVTVLKSCAYSKTIPVMTSNTAPSGTAAATTVYGTNYPYLAFDNSLATCAYGYPQYNNWRLSYQFNTTPINYVFYYAEIDSSGYTSVTRTFSVKFQISNNGTTWVDATSAFNIVRSSESTIITDEKPLTNFTPVNNVAFLQISDSSNVATLQVFRLQFYGLDLS